MKKYLFTAIAAAVFSTAAFAQDYKKTEFFAGYSHGQVDESNSRFFTTGNFDIGPGKFHGFNVAGVYNFSRYIGVKGDVSGTYDRGDFRIGGATPSAVTGTTRNSLYNVLGGVQFKDNSADRRVKPFGHVMVGAGFARSKVTLSCSGSSCPGGLIVPEESQTGLASVFGGGVDIKISDRIDLRAVQLDYNPIRYSNSIDHNVRIGVGIVLK
jgi:opacity protein-like surface antigen